MSPNPQKEVLQIDWNQHGTSFEILSPSCHLIPADELVIEQSALSTMIK